jgi:DNA repair exonuclease SbcCD ATPase subunit
MQLHKLRFSNLAFGAVAKSQPGAPWADKQRVVDFDAMPQGIIRIAGLNGTGKSTMLSLSGPGTLYGRDPSQGDVYGLAGAGPSFSEIEFSMAGHRYLARVDMSRGLKRARGTGELSEKKSREFRLFQDGELLAQGEAGYRDAVEALVGTNEDLLAVAYQLQRNAEHDARTLTSFAAATADQREEILRRYMGLEAIQVLVDRATEEAKTLSAKVADLRPQLEASDAAKLRLAELTERRPQAAQAAADAKRELQGATAALTAAKAAHAEAVGRLQAAQAAKRRVDELLAEEAARTAAVAAVASAESRLEAAKVDVERAEAAVSDAAQRLDLARAASQDVAARAAAYDQARSARDRAKAARDAAEAEQRKAAGQVSEVTRGCTDTRGRLAAARDALTGAEAASAAAGEALAAAASAEAKASTELKGIEQQGQQLAEQRQPLQLDLDTAAEDVTSARLAVNNATAKRAQLETRVTHLEAEVQRLTRQSSLCDAVPCHGAGEYAGCQLLADAVQARALLEGPTAKLAEAQVDLSAAERAVTSAQAALDLAFERQATAKAALDAASEAAEPLRAAYRRAREDHSLTCAATDQARMHAESAKARLAVSQTTVATLEERLTAQEAAITQGEAVASAAAARLADAELRLGEAEATLAATPAPTGDAARAFAAAQAAVASAQDRLRQAQALRDSAATALAEASGRLARAREASVVSQELAAAQAAATDTGFADELSRLATAVGGAEAFERQAQQAFEAASAELHRLDGSCAENEHRIAELAPIATRAEALATQHRRTVRLRDDLARLIRLRIEASLEELTSRINGLLEHVSAGRFSVRFEVETVTQAGKPKPAYSQVVFDAQTNSDREVRHYSGGQQTIVRVATQLGLMLYANSHRAIPLQTVWLDEFDSALDADGEFRPGVMALLRAFVETMRTTVGDVRVLVVSHAPDFDADFTFRAETIAVRPLSEPSALLEAA